MRAWGTQAGELIAALPEGSSYHRDISLSDQVQKMPWEPPLRLGVYTGSSTSPEEAGRRIAAMMGVAADLFELEGMPEVDLRLNNSLLFRPRIGDLSTANSCSQAENYAVIRRPMYHALTTAEEHYGWEMEEWVECLKV